MEALTFNSNGSRLSATLYHANNGKSQLPNPGVVVIGSWLTVKEQMAANYASRLAAAGFTALTFDFRGFGGSEGAPRELESARSKAEDILNAAAFLQSVPQVDAERIGVLAVCASAGYSALALQGAAPETSVVKSVAMVAPWLHDAQITAQLYGGAEAIRARLLRARTARKHYVSTGEVEYVSAASNRDPSAAMYAEGDSLDYYLNPLRGALPAWGGRFAVMAWTEWLQTDFVALAPGLAMPLCIVTGPGTATPSGVERFVSRLPRQPALASMAGTQFDFYDQAAQVSFSCARAVQHFRDTLSS